VAHEADTRAVLSELVQRERRALVATMVKRTQSIDIAEEAVDRAFEAAFAQWPLDGLPDNPRAWLYRAAAHKATDALRHHKMSERVHEDLARSMEPSFDEEPTNEAFPDDQLRLIFTCCHPALSTEAQVALALRLLSGLSTEEVARAFAVPEVTMAQRLVRAKNKIRAAKIPYEVPEASELGERLVAVLDVVYAIFNEGYVATGGDSLLRVDLAAEALRLSQLLIALLPERREPISLHALLLLIDARRPARVSTDGELVLLADQDRTLWDRVQVERGKALLEQSLRRPGEVDHYAIEASIQALHDEAKTYAETDFTQIAALYRILRERADSPLVELNEAVAIAMASGPEAGLARVLDMKKRDVLTENHLLYATEADLLRRLGRTADAKKAYERAIALVSNNVERTFLEKQLRAL
jgi:RNA polymerase sigma-70 factor (ECF subfamily)